MQKIMVSMIRFAYRNGRSFQKEWRFKLSAVLNIIYSAADIWGREGEEIPVPSGGADASVFGELMSGDNGYSSALTASNGLSDISSLDQMLSFLMKAGFSVLLAAVLVLVLFLILEICCARRLFLIVKAGFEEEDELSVLIGICGFLCFFFAHMGSPWIWLLGFVSAWSLGTVGKQRF